MRIYGIYLALLWCAQATVFAQETPAPLAPKVDAPVAATPDAATSNAATSNAATPVPGAATSAPADADEYEIDYEEEPGSETDEAAAPPPKKAKKTVKLGSGPAVQGSRAKHRFTPILKSEMKSVYQKEGKSLDVDPN